MGFIKFTKGTSLSDKDRKALQKLLGAEKKKLQSDIETYGQEMDQKAIQLFKQMVQYINDESGTAMVDPSTRQKVAARRSRLLGLGRLRTVGTEHHNPLSHLWFLSPRPVLTDRAV